MLAETYVENRRLAEGVAKHLELMHDAFNGTTASSWRQRGESHPPPRALAFQLASAPILPLIQLGDNQLALDLARNVLGWDGSTPQHLVNQNPILKQYCVELGALPKALHNQTVIEAEVSPEMAPGYLEAMAKDAKNTIVQTENLLPLLHMRLGNYEAALHGFCDMWMQNQGSMLAIALLQATARNLCRENKDECESVLQSPLRSLHPYREAAVPEGKNWTTIADVLTAATEHYKSVVAAADNRYSGFRYDTAPLRPPVAYSGSPSGPTYEPIERLSTWTPRELDSMPTAMEFLQFIRKREPFIVRMDKSNSTHYFDSTDGVSEDDINVRPCGEVTSRTFGWNACNWVPEYMCKWTGSERASLATSRAGKHGVFAVCDQYVHRASLVVRGLSFNVVTFLLWAWCRVTRCVRQALTWNCQLTFLVGDLETEVLFVPAGL